MHPPIHVVDQQKHVVDQQKHCVDLNCIDPSNPHVDPSNHLLRSGHCVKPVLVIIRISVADSKFTNGSVSGAVTLL